MNPSLSALVSMPRLSPRTKTRHTYERVEKVVTFYKLTLNWSRFLFCTIAREKKNKKQKERFRRQPARDRCPTSSPRYVTESGNGRPDIDPCSYIAAGWGPLGVVSPHRHAPARAVPSNANRASTIDFCRRDEPALFTLASMSHLSPMTKTRHAHSRAPPHKRVKVEKAALRGGWGWRKGRRTEEGDDFRCRRSRWVSSKKRRSSRRWHVRNRHVRSALGAESGRVDEEVNRVRRYREVRSSSPRVQNAMRPWYLAPRGRPGRPLR